MSTDSVFRRVNWLMIVVCLFSLVFSSFVGTQTSPKVQAATTPTITEFPIPSGSSSLGDITSGVNGNLWFADWANNKGSIGRIAPNGTIAEFPIPSGSYAGGLTLGSDGNIWFTESSGGSNGKIGRITPDGVINELSIPTWDSYPMGITSGSDGNLWFTEYGTWANKIGRITTSGAITEFTIPTAQSSSLNIVSGSDGNLWFNEFVANKIGRITTDGVINEFSIPTANSDTSDITKGVDGNVWFIEEADKIGMITPSGAITETPISTSGTTPYGIVAGADGNLWIAEESGNSIGLVSPGGVLTSIPIPTMNSGSQYITSGPDGNIWFTEVAGNKIGRVNIAQSIKPGGKWVTKTGFNVAVGKSFTFQASAYPTHSGDLAIAHVNFTATWPGHGWVDICGNVTKHDSKNVYSCSTDFTKLNGGIPVSQGSITVTFNITDIKNNVSEAPNGSLSGKISSPLLNVPFASQYQGQAFQNTDCGPTSIAMTLKFYNRGPGLNANAIWQIRQATGNTNPTSPDTNVDELNKALTQSYKSQTSILTNPGSVSSIDQQLKNTLVAALQKGHPVIILLNGIDLGRGSAYGGHFLVLVGISLDGNTVYVNDPDLRTSAQLKNLPKGWMNGGQNISLSKSVFEKAILDGKVNDSHDAIIVS